MASGVVFGALWCQTALAALNIALPINNQVPPVARVLESYSFQFASNTYTTTEGTGLTYSISQAPAWLELDTISHTLLGTPAAKDVGLFTFVLAATDGLGVVDSRVTLVVVDLVAPRFTGNISAALAAAGTISGSSTLALGPGASFSIAVGRDYFQSSRELFLYATSVDRSPLPSWISFDAATATFTGAAPPPATAPREYGISLFASQVAGFAEVSVTFAIAIVNHKLLFSSVIFRFTFFSLANITAAIGPYLTLDGQPVPLDMIASVDGRRPSWLALDPTTLMLSGSAPAGTVSEEATISVVDIFGDEASVVIWISFATMTATSTSYTEIESARTSSGILIPGTISTTLGSPLQSYMSGDGSTATGGITTPTDPGDDSSRGLSKGDIAAIVVLPVLFLVALLFCCMCFAIRMKRRCRAYTGGKVQDLIFESTHNASEEQQRHGLHTSSWPPPVGLGIEAAHGNDGIQTIREIAGNESGGLEELPTPQSVVRSADAGRMNSNQGHGIDSDLQQRGTEGGKLPPSRHTISNMAARRSAELANSTALSGSFIPPPLQMGPVVRGAGHGRRPAESDGSGYIRASMMRSSRTSRESEGMNGGSFAQRNGRHYSVFGSGGGTENEGQGRTTIRKVSLMASGNLTTDVQARPFSEKRQSFISRRASNPQRPLFSAGAGAADLRSSSIAESEASQRRMPQDVVSSGRTMENPLSKGSRLLQDAFQRGFPRAASTRSSSKDWLDIDSDSRYTLEGNEESILDPEESRGEVGVVQPLQIRKWSSAMSQMPTAAGRSETMASDEARGTGSSAFI